MRVSSSDHRARAVLAHQARCAALQQFHNQDGDWRDGRYMVSLFERHGWFRWICDHLRSHPDDFALKRPFPFLKRFLLRLLALAAAPFATLALSVWAPLVCLLAQKRAIQERDEKQLLPDRLTLSRFSLATTSFTGPFTFIFAFFFGPILERWGMSMLLISLLWPLALLLFLAQFVVVTIAASLAPVIGLGFVAWYVLRSVFTSLGESLGRLGEPITIEGTDGTHQAPSSMDEAGGER